MLRDSSEPSITRRHPSAECERCPLNNDKTVFVSGGGPDKANIVVVGEAPGYQEAKTGRPFTGPSGKLLDMVLDNFGLSRADCYVTNATLCRPVDNATPPKEAVRACWPRLKEEIVEHEPQYILTLGNTASQVILGSREGVTKLRTGPPRPTDLVDGARVIATVHPAACLRQSDMFPSLVTDVGKIVSNVQQSWSPPVYKVFESPAEALHALDELQRVSLPIAFDIEVGIDKDADFDHPDRYQLLCVGFGYAMGKVAVIGEGACNDRRVQEAMARLLETKQLIAHNGKFDIAGMWKYGKGKLFFDTMLASYCVDERPGTHGLKYLAAEILGAPDYDKDLKAIVGKGSYAAAPRPMLYEYNAYDVACTYALYEYYVDRLEREGLRALHDFLVEKSMDLMHLELEGLRVDQDYIGNLTKEYTLALEEIEEGLQDIAGRGFNPRSPKQVMEYLASVNVPVDSSNEETLVGLITRGKAVEFCERMLVQRREQKLFGTYVKGTAKRLYKERVHPTFLLHGTVTGRLACRNPNLQNVPRDSSIRRLFVPGPGNVFIQGDYSQAELRVMATRSEDKWLKDIFDSDRDIHSEVALRFFGPNFTKDQRVRAKAYVFGLAYGREALSIAMEYGIPISEAESQMREFFDAMPELSAWRKQIKYQILSGEEDLVSHFGRHRRFHLITKENKKDVVKEGLAFYPQADASDINLCALSNLRSAGLDCRLPVHDSNLVECKKEDAIDVAHEVKRIMEETPREVYTDYVDFKVDVNIGDSWGDLDEAS